MRWHYFLFMEWMPNPGLFMLIANVDLAEAVVFFDRGQVSREMLHTEFEAILDAVVPMVEFSDSTAQAVYLRINSNFQITAAVYFLINFDASGIADKRWNIPLQQLADSSARGPDLGAGPIRLACQSQCGIAWQQKNLWDPDMAPQSNTFVQLRKTVVRNRLGLEFKNDERAQIPPVIPKADVQSPTSAAALVASSKAELKKGLQKELSAHYKLQYEQEFRNRMAQQLKEQRLRVTTLNNQNVENTQVLQRKHLARMDELRSQLEAQQLQLAQSEARNKQLKDTIDGQAEKIQGLREYFEHKLEEQEAGGASQISALNENYQLELDAKINAATTEYKEQLELRDFELVYRHELEASLREEVEQLQQENQNLMANSGDQLLQKLSEGGLNFVAYHPGAGYLTIPVQEMSRYLADKEAYAAEKTGVSVGHYRNWLAHYKRPCCAALKTNGEPCAVLIEKILDPSDFHLGENDRCIAHQTQHSAVGGVAR